MKNKLYWKQYTFIRTIIGFGIALGLYLYYPSALEKIPNWLLITLLVIFGLYTVWKTFWGVISIMSSHDDYAVPFALLETDNPQYPIKTDAEHIALLAAGLYESSDIAVSDKENVKALHADPLFKPAHRLQYKSYFYLNALEYGSDPKNEGGLADSIELSWGIHDRETALEQLNALWNDALSAEDISIADYPNTKEYTKFIEELGLTFKDENKQTNLSGFDIIRFIYISRVSFVCGYINEEELRDFLAQAGAFIKANYANWEELAYSYLVTFIDWAKNTNVDYFVIRERVICVKAYLTSEVSQLRKTSLLS